jgi:hypothetical protein
MISTPIGKVFASTLSRSLAIALDPAPKYPSTSRVSSFSEDKLERVLSNLKSLPGRPGLVDGFETLWKAGFEVYAVSNGATATTKGYLANLEPKSKPDIFTSGEFDKYIISCDEVKKAKPSPDVVSLPNFPTFAKMILLMCVLPSVQAYSPESRSRPCQGHLLVCSSPYMGSFAGSSSRFQNSLCDI